MLVVSAVEPTPRALPLSIVGNANTDLVVPLRANVLVPDAGELNWAVNVPEMPSVTVKSVRVEAHGLWHEHASDLTCVAAVGDVCDCATMGCRVVHAFVW